MKATFFKILMGVSGLGALGVAAPLAESVAHAQVTVRVAEPSATYRVRVAPPAPREEIRVAAPSSRHVWVGGYWGWSHGRHTWIRGRWQLPPGEGRVWIGPRWANEGGYWRFHPGYWGVGEGYVQPVQEVPQGEVYADVEPPAAQVEVVGVAPSPNHFWVGGHWGWAGGRHVWVGGRWEMRREGYNYAPGAWVREGPRWHWREGHWRR